MLTVFSRQIISEVSKLAAVVKKTTEESVKCKPQESEKRQLQSGF